MFYPFYYDKTKLILIPAVIIAFWAQGKVSSTYRKYRDQRMANCYTGVQVARMILDGAGLYNVPVLLTEGELSDHYDPSKRLIKLSRDILDRQVEDIEGSKIRLVNDVEISSKRGNYYIIGVDIGINGLFRRLGLGNISKKFYKIA